VTVLQFDARARVRENDRLVRREMRRRRWRRRLDDLRFGWRMRLARVRFRGDRAVVALMVFAGLALLLASLRVPLLLAAAFAASITLNLVALALHLQGRRR
jgi:hypothetical protein